MRGFLLLAILVLLVHLAWILWVLFGALCTRRRKSLSAIHIVSLCYAIVIEVSKWPCPLTLLEQNLQRRAGAAAYEGSFVAHYLEAVIYPNVPLKLLVPAAVLICCLNLAVYIRRYRRREF